MRRAFSALLLGGILLTAPACGTTAGSPGANPTGPAAATTPPAGPACAALAKVYDQNMGPYAQALTLLTTDPQALAQAQQTLTTFGSAVREATRGSADTELEAAGRQAAEQMQKAAEDSAFFTAITSSEDVAEAVGPTLSKWLGPVQKRCS